MKPLLHSIVQEETLTAMVDSFFVSVGLPIRIIDDKNNSLINRGETTEYCKRFQKYLPQDDSCSKQHSSASQKAISLGEPYIFECHAELSNIVFPLTRKKTFLGSVQVGPFLLDDPDSILISEVVKKYEFSTDDALELYDEAGELPIVPPAKVTQISRLLFYMFGGLITDSKEELRLNNQKLLQQSLISDSIQRYKSENISDNYPYEKEKELINKVKIGNAKEANALLNDLLGYVFFSKGNSMDVVKSRSVELCSLLSRTAIEGGAPTDNMLRLNNQFLNDIQHIDNLDDLCFELQEVVNAFCESLFEYIPSKNSELIKKAILFIAENFNQSLSLEAVAEHVHLHPSYFSTLFKQSTGSSFKEYLNMVRIEESKRLLSNTDFSIIDVAIATGFEDQSYFSKVFKKYTGQTPKQYR